MLPVVTVDRPKLFVGLSMSEHLDQMNNWLRLRGAKDDWPQLFPSAWRTSPCLLVFARAVVAGRTTVSEVPKQFSLFQDVWTVCSECSGYSSTTSLLDQPKEL